MTLFGFGILFVAALLCSWFIDFVLVVVGLVSQKSALSYIRFSLFGILGAAVVMAIIGAIV